jgi:hypothetical protein
MDDRFAVIDAFVDGERVDTADLKQALADEGGRDYFVDVWLLREGVQDELVREPVPNIPLRRHAERRWPLLALAASIVCLVGGGVAGYRLADRGRTADAAPPTVQTPAMTSFPAPAPTLSIPVEFTADGRASRGGD